jgi:predicted DNA-binding protein (UPF0251 family)
MEELLDHERVKLRSEDRVEDFRFLQRTEGLSVEEAARRMGIWPATLYRALQKAGEKP